MQAYMDCEYGFGQRVPELEGALAQNTTFNQTLGVLFFYGNSQYKLRPHK